MSKKEIALKTPVLSIEKIFKQCINQQFVIHSLCQKKIQKSIQFEKKKSLMNVVAQIHFNFIVQKKYCFTDANCIYLTLQPLRLNCEFSPLAATQFLIN